MIAFVIAAVGMLVAVIPLGILAWRGTLMEAVVAYQAITSIIVIVLVLLCQGFDRSAEFELPVSAAVLLLGGGLVFIRALERWL